MPLERRRTKASVTRPNVVAGTAPGARSGLDSRIRVIEFAGDRMEVVSPFGDGERNDPRRRIGHLFQDGVRIVRRVQVLHDRSDHPWLPASVRGFLDQGVKTVLGLHRLLHLEVEWHHADATDSPVQCRAPLHELIEVHRLVGPVEPTHTEVHDADLHLCAVIARHRNRKRSQIGLVQCSHLNRALLDGTEGQALHQLVLCSEAGDDHRQRNDRRSRAHLGQEQTLGGHEAGQEHRRRSGDHAGQCVR